MFKINTSNIKFYGIFIMMIIAFPMLYYDNYVEKIRSIYFASWLIIFFIFGILPNNFKLRKNKTQLK